MQLQSNCDLLLLLIVVNYISIEIFKPLPTSVYIIRITNIAATLKNYSK